MTAKAVSAAAAEDQQRDVVVLRGSVGELQERLEPAVEQLGGGREGMVADHGLQTCDAKEASIHIDGICHTVGVEYESIAGCLFDPVEAVITVLGDRQRQAGRFEVAHLAVVQQGGSAGRLFLCTCRASSISAARRSFSAVVS